MKYKKLLCSMILATVFMGFKQNVMASDKTIVIEDLSRQEDAASTIDCFADVPLNEMVVCSGSNGKWIQNSTGWWYQYADGTYPKNGWATIDGSKYYFNSNGYMRTGWLNDNGKYFYLEESGRPAVNKWISGTYYVKADGSMAVSEWVDNNKYYVDASGKWVKNKTNGKWIQNSTGWWYQYADGTYPKNGWATIDGSKYYFNSNGYMRTGWLNDNGKYYYLEGSGRPAVNKWISGTYYVKADGSMAVSEWVDNNKYYVDANGKKIEAPKGEQWETPIL